MWRTSAFKLYVDVLFFMSGGTASVYVGQPLDTVKVKMQTFPTLHTSGLRCFMTTLRQEGVVRGLYAGTVPSLAAQVLVSFSITFCLLVLSTSSVGVSVQMC